MDEREERRRRRDALLQSRNRTNGKKSNGESTGEFFLFRTYVTIILVGVVFLLSFLHTEKIEVMMTSLKSAIAYEMSIDNVKVTGKKVVAFFEKKGNTDSEQTSTTDITGKKDKTAQPEVFLPDLDEADEDIP